MGGIGVISNPRSRRNRRDPALARQLAYVLGEQGEHVAPGDLEALHRVAERFLDRGIDILAINGGDGTCHTVLTAFYRVYRERPLPRLALLRGGTMNTVASGLGIRGRPDDLLGRLVRCYHSGRPLREVERTLLIAGDQVGFLFGNGLISNFLEVYYRGREPSPIKAAGLVLRAAASALLGGAFIRGLTRRVRCRVLLDDAVWEERDWLSISAGTVDDIGLGFRPFYAAPQHPGCIHAVGWETSALELALQLPRIRLGRPHRHPRIAERVCRSMVIEAEEDLSFMVDGDFHRGGRRLNVASGPRITIVIPG